MKIFKTTNFDLSSFLVSERCELAGVEKINNSSNKLLFCFYDNKKLQELINLFYSLQAIVKPQDFVNAQRTLKSIIYSQKRQDEYKQ